MRGQHETWARFAAIVYDSNSRQFVYYARQWNDQATSYICQLPMQGLFKYQYVGYNNLILRYYVPAHRALRSAAIHPSVCPICSYFKTAHFMVHTTIVCQSGDGLPCE